MNARLKNILAARAAVERAETRREVTAAWGSLQELRCRAREEFAAQRGWVAVPTFTTGQLLGLSGRSASDVPGTDDAIDHRSCFGLPVVGRRKARPVAIVSHIYGDVARCFQFADRYRLAIEILPASWWWPGQATAVLFVRGTP